MTKKIYAQNVSKMPDFPRWGMYQTINYYAWNQSIYQKSKFETSIGSRHKIWCIYWYKIANKYVIMYKFYHVICCYIYSY